MHHIELNFDATYNAIIAMANGMRLEDFLANLAKAGKPQNTKGWGKFVGAWADKDIDGLTHQNKMRAEWD